MQSWKEKTKKCWDCEWNWTFSSGCNACVFLVAFCLSTGFVHLAGLTQGRYNDVNCAWKGCWMPWCWEICRSSWNCWGGEILTAVVKPTQLKMMVVSRVIMIDYIYSDGLFDMVCQPRTFAKRSIYLWFAFFQFGTTFLITWSFKNSKEKTQKSHHFNPTDIYEFFTSLPVLGSRFSTTSHLSLPGLWGVQLLDPKRLGRNDQRPSWGEWIPLMEGIIYSSNLGGGFKYFFSLSGEDCHLDSYFSKGLKPPTSNLLRGNSYSFHLFPGGIEVPKLCNSG